MYEPLGESQRRPLATLKLNHDALGLSIFRKENVQQAELVKWLFELGERLAQLGLFCSTVACEIEKGDHGASSLLVCHEKETQ